MLNPGSFSRRAPLILLWTALLCAAMAVSPAGAQSVPVHLAPQTPPPEPLPAAAESDAPLRTRTKPLVMNVDLVLVPATVTDQKNRPVLGLKREDFALFEGEEQQEIRHFAQEDGPISLGVILDLSKSMTNKIDVAREAVSQFFEAGNPQDDYFVVTFSNRPRVLADATQSIGHIQAQLATARPDGRTALLDAIYLGIQKAHRSKYQRRALLIISDGGDNSSRYRAGEIKRMVQEADVEIYAIGIFDGIFRTPEEWYGKRLLTEITESTGGRTITLDNPGRLPETAAQVSAELRSQYVLGYRPKQAARDGKWRKIRVRLNLDPGAAPLQVYSRRGYLAPGE